MSRPTPGAPSLRPPGVTSPVFVALWVSSLAVFVSTQLLTASLPLYAAGLGAGDAVLGLMAGSIATVSLLARPWVGIWLDRGGVVPAFMTGAGLTGVCALGYWLTGSVAGVLAFRMVTGLAIALYHTSGQMLAVTLAPAGRVAAALSFYSLAAPIAQLVGPPTGVGLASALGYPGLFAAGIAASLLGVALAMPLRALRPGPAPSRRVFLNRRVTVPGLWMLALMVPFGANVALLAVHASRRGLGNPGVLFTAMAVGLLAALLTVGRRADRGSRLGFVVPGLALGAAGMWITAAVHGWVLVAGGVLSGLALGVAQPVLYALAADLVPSEERGSAMATMGIFLEIGIGLGAIGGGLVGRATGLPLMFVLAGCMPALGALLALLPYRVRRGAT